MESCTHKFYNEGEIIQPEDFSRMGVLIPHQMDTAAFRDNCAHSDPRLVATFAHGRFPTEDPELQVILSSWLDRHVNFWKQHNQGIISTCFGYDPSRSKHGDLNSLTGGSDDGIKAIHKWNSDDTVFSADKVVQLAESAHGIDLTAGRNPIAIDIDGLGVGVNDILKNRGVWTIEFRGNTPSQVDPRRYANRRTEAYATLGRRLDPADIWKDKLFALPDDVMLHEELTAPEKVYPPNDALRFILMQKNTPSGQDTMSVHKKLGRSPDSGDSVVYFFDAVRLLYNLNSFFQLAEAPLVSYPARPSTLPPTDVLSERLKKLKAERGLV